MASLEGGIKALLKYYQTRLGLEEARRQAELQEMERRLREQIQLAQLAQLQQELEQQSKMFPLTIERLQTQLAGEKLQTQLTEHHLAQLQQQQKLAQTLATLPPIEQGIESWLAAVDTLPLDEKSLIVTSPFYTKVLEQHLQQKQRQEQLKAITENLDTYAISHGITDKNLIAGYKNMLKQGVPVELVNEAIKAEAAQIARKQELEVAENRLMQSQAKAATQPSPIGKTVRPISITDNKNLVNLADAILKPLRRVMGKTQFSYPQFVLDLVSLVNENVTSFIVKYGNAVIQDSAGKEQLVDTIFRQLIDKHPEWNTIMSTPAWKALAPGGIAHHDLVELQKHGDTFLKNAIRTLLNQLITAKGVFTITGEGLQEEAALADLLAKLENLPAMEVVQ